METTAKIFKNGRSQAIRLPKEFRFSGDEVKICRDGKKVILEPLDRTEWSEGFWAMFSFDPDFETHPALPPMPIDLDQS